jgi:hypothetical protein
MVQALLEATDKSDTGTRTYYKDIIKTYIISLYERYKNEIQKNKYLILEQEKRRLIRTHSMSMSLQCVNYSFELAKINHIYKEKYDNKNLGGQTGYIYIIKSILNYIFYQFYLLNIY